MTAMDLLIEREFELNVLKDVIGAAVDGRGGAVLIEGEAGIGKTRLLACAREEASACGARVLYGTADETEAGVPLAAARVLLARAARGLRRDGPGRLGMLAFDGQLSDATGPGSRADEVVHALWWVIVELADERPLAVVFDDAQWADELTLRLVRVAARRAPEIPLVLVIAARPAAPGRPHAALGAERGFVRLEPAPLSADGIARMLEQVSGRPGAAAAAAEARALTGGNPLYLWELLRERRVDGVDVSGELVLKGRPPRGLVRLVADRLRRLAPDAATLAHAVAVLGADAQPVRVRALAGLEGAQALDAEEELRVERVLDADAWAFAHPLLAAAAREGIGAAELGRLHARAAELLAADGADDQRVAEHLLRAPPRGDAAVVATLRRAADVARRLGDARTAARLLERARAEPAPLELAETVEFERGRALMEADDEDGARALRRIATRAVEASVRIGAARQLATRLAIDGRGDDAVALLRGVVATLDDAHREDRLELLADLTLIARDVLGRREQLMGTLASDIAGSSAGSPAERLLLVASNVAGGDLPPDPVGAARWLLAQRWHRQHPSGFAVGSLTFAATALLINADALDDAERAMDVLRADAEELALPHLIAGAVWQQAEIAYHRGDLARCQLEARAAIEAGGDFARRLATPWLVMAHTEQGRLDEAEALLHSLGMLGVIAPSALLTDMLGSRGRLRLAQGNAERAVEDLHAARERSAERYRQRVEPPWRPMLVEALVLADRGAEAIREAEDYAELAAQWGTPRALGHAARLRALVAPRERAIALLEQARTEFEASSARLELARCLTELGTHRRAKGERRAARAVLRDAHDAAHACSADALCERARAELLLCGGRPRPPAGAGAAALTAAERRVAELAAEGATNRQIARRLYLSPKTVEMHLRSTYRKLELTGRDALAAALR